MGERGKCSTAKECAAGNKCMQAAGFEPATFRLEFDNPDQRPDGRTKGEQGKTLYPLSYACMRLRDRIRTCVLEVPDFALFY